MEELSDLEHIRKRPGMYVGGTNERGLHHLFVELLDNLIDQHLARRATTIRVSVDGERLEVADDGPGLPFDIRHESGQPLASRYLTKIRRDDPTADGHVPHVHLGGWGCGLRVVTALSHFCEVQSWREGELWSQSFLQGVEDGPAIVTQKRNGCGTTIRLSIDREVFSSAVWKEERIERRLTQAAYLFPRLQVETPNLSLCAKRGLLDWAEKLAVERGQSSRGGSRWFSGIVGGLHVQAAVAGTGGSDTLWCSFANGNTTTEGGSHLDALKQAVSQCDLSPSVGMIHVVMQTPSFAGPTRGKLDVPEIQAPIASAVSEHFLKSDIDC